MSLRGGRIGISLSSVHLSKICIIFLAVAISCTILFLTTETGQYFTYKPLRSPSETSLEKWKLGGWPVKSPPPPSVRQDRRFVLLLPATSPDPNLCKTILSAIAVGYPAPIIVGWGMDHTTVTKWKGGRNLIKVPGVLDYLDAALREDAHPSEQLQHDDIVIIADSYDVWFQLPPEVLLKRYHEINDQAEARLRKEWPGSEPMPMQQTIIAASEKNCFPRPDWGSDIQCPSLPDSPIREDLYGPETDKSQNDKYRLRPRYINGGMYMGPAGDVRDWFRRAHNIMQTKIGEGMKFRSEQGITGQVFGEQEVWRTWRRNNAHTNDENMLAPDLLQRDFEFGIGLDYYQTISAQTMHSEDDGRIIKLNDQKTINNHSAELEISPVRLQGLPEDVKPVQIPVPDLADGPEWGELPLYANFYTESVPVILHHNSEDHKGLREDWWHLPWFFPHLRDLVTRQLGVVTEKEEDADTRAHAEATKEDTADWANVDVRDEKEKPDVEDVTREEPKMPVLATVETEDGIFTYRPLSAEKEGRKPRIMGESVAERLKENDWDDTCGKPGEAWWDEVFRDGKGTLA